MAAVWINHIPSLSDDPKHPVQIALRTYALALSLSLGPSLVPFVTTLLTGTKPLHANYPALQRLLKRELGYNGFAFAFTVSVGGGAALHHLWNNASTGTSINSLSLTSISPERKWPEQDVRSAKRWLGFREAHTQWGSMMALMKKWLKRIRLDPEQRTFFANVIASFIGILLLQEGREKARRLGKPRSKRHTNTVSPTLDLTLLLSVRALDSLLQSLMKAYFEGKESQDIRNGGSLAVERHGLRPELDVVKGHLGKAQPRRNNVLRDKISMRVDSLLFWVCSARIMWCFFYEPQRLPGSYVKWINTLANVDLRVLNFLNLIRERKWMYGNPQPAYVNYLKPYAEGLGYPKSWADPLILPAKGGPPANAIWKRLGVDSRPGVGGLPCELVHREVGSSLGLSHSCLANAVLRGGKAFLEALAIYIPVHFLPVLMTRPRTLLCTHGFLRTVVGALRSAAFLSTFLSSYWFAVCFTRSLVLAKYLPRVSHNFWDGPYGGVLAGSLLCGNSIWIENGRRRGEMALYVMPKALRACLPDRWLNMTNRRVRIAERIIVILSISRLLTAAVHQPETLRGLSRWTLSFIMNGPNISFWKRRRRDPGTSTTSHCSHTLAEVSNDEIPTGESGPSEAHLSRI